MKLLSNVFLLISVVYLSSCGHSDTLHCPAFADTTMYSWFPYHYVGSTFVFSDSLDRQRIYEVRSVSNSPYHEVNVYYSWTGAKQGGTADQNECYIYGGSSLVADDGLVSIGISYRVFTKDAKPTGNTITVSVGGFWIEFEKRADNELYVMTNSPYYSAVALGNMTINGRSYNNVSACTSTDTALLNKYSRKADKIYFAKGEGVVGYRTYPEGVEYWLK